jgi:hypothetical protein
MLIAAILSTADFEALDKGVAACDRHAVNPIFAGEAGRRSAFLTDAFAEQEAIVMLRADIAARRRAVREGHGAADDTDEALALQQLAVDDRQRALDDRRRLERLRVEALDAKRHYYLVHCASGKDY